MNWLNKLERRLGKFAIPHMILYVIAGQVLFTLIAFTQPGVVGQMTLDPVAVMNGEYWRLLTFILIPDTSPIGLLTAIFWFYFLWMIGQSLENEWGSFKLNVYLLSGLAFQAALSLILLNCFGIDLIQGGFYWSLSLMLAFAYLFPDVTIYAFLILPVKIKWLAWLAGAYLVFSAVTGGILATILIAVSLVNYFLFFGPNFIMNLRTRSNTMAVRASMQASVARAMSTAPVKQCQQCQKDGLAADIRLCTCERCGAEGKFWCMEHLGGHLKKI